MIQNFEGLKEFDSFEGLYRYDICISPINCTITTTQSALTLLNFIIEIGLS